ncbi:MAG: PD40 domain-containing protein, partial [Acidobacteria bacterium]|nr:PD40 domain-containing protein [Acidobacteriota bacterium]
MRTRTKGGASALWVAIALGFAVLIDAPSAGAQTPFVPYYGKNIVRYKDFKWKVYNTDHFEIYYYTDIEKHLERVASYAESAYQQVSSDLKHDLAFKVPMIIFKTHTEFEQENVIPGAVQEGVAAFAESDRNRMLLPLDEPPDLLYRTITHELTHVFQFDIIPQSLIRRNVPLWVAEGHADFVTGYWAPIDLMTVRDAAVADIVPKISEMEDYGNFSNPRLVYNLGHAAFEFIESKWGREGVRQFLFSLRKNVIGGGENPYEDSLKLTPEEFDQQFDKFLKDRFKPFRDKERPADYGRNLAPKPEKTHYTNALTAEPSPSGDLIAIVTANRSDREYDIVLVSSKDGAIVRNLTSGFDQARGWENLSIPGVRWNTVPWLTWAPNGDRLAYFVRTEDYQTLVLQNVLTRKTEVRIPMKSVNAPESPAFSPDGRVIAFSALRDAKSDIYAVNVETREVTAVTSDEFFNYAPTFSPDGKFIVYMSRVSGNEKLFRFDLEKKQRTQLTFGTHDDAAARFYDADTLVFPSTATDPAQPIDPVVAKNGNVYNLWTLSLKTGELRQFTDALTGNVDPVILKSEKGPKVAFVSYYKGEYGLSTMDISKPVTTAASSDFGAPGPIIDFQAPLSHTLIAKNVKKKGTFEKLFLDGRPPINVGVTSGGDIFGGTAISFADVLGDQRFDIYAASVAQYRTFGASWVNLSRRFQYALQGFSQTDFYYGQYGGVFYDPIYNPY